MGSVRDDPPRGQRHRPGSSAVTSTNFLTTISSTLPSRPPSFPYVHHLGTCRLCNRWVIFHSCYYSVPLPICSLFLFTCFYNSCFSRRLPAPLPPILRS